MIKHSITNMRISGLLLSLSTLVIFSTISSSSSTLIPFRKNISTLDFGRIIESNPLAILNPESPKEIAQLIQSIFSNETLMINMTVAQRGAAHSTYGQSQTSTSNGIIVNMTQLPSFIHIEESFADVAGGVLWVDLLAESLKKGRSPRSWTDYLYLSVGGTLSVAGISGQTFKHGPQISNVIELDVITGRGEQFTCSEKMNADLFYGVLGGLGQFGIITRARIILHSAPKMVKWVKVKYESFDQFIKDQEFLISQGVVDYLEGEIILQHKNLSKVSPRGLNVSYSIEFVIHYDEEIVAQKKLDEILDELKKGGTMAPLPKIEDASYFDFLNRVRKEEMELRKEGLWEVAHPWLNVFVPRAHIKRFKDLLVETIADTYTAGPLIIYPILRHKYSSSSFLFSTSFSYLIKKKQAK
ncbi:Cytokinin dehydrogenase 3 [Apostasia shenzhenica]|uniref:cytokinin dehydrogenase n=1 Tax=Apostasia shenzhenica TaxID=1088818 RepID=A0A2I0ADB0_9ASPA|nr:Cytokinin dehydrogenase 3 [Apostasia shenzhenica]